MLKRVRGLGGQAALRDQLGLDELHERPLQRRSVQGRYRLYQVIGEGPPHERAQLRHEFRRCQAIQPGHQRVVQRGGDRQRWQGARQLIALLLLLEQA
jgi:hypothetical protein